jgi:hypothetical protein
MTLYLGVYFLLPKKLKSNVNYIRHNFMAIIYKLSYLVMSGILEVPVEVSAEVKVKKPRASRAKPKAVDVPVEASAEVKVKKPRASRAKPKAVDVPVVAIGSPAIPIGNVAMPEISQMLPVLDPKWVKFRDVLSSGKYDKLRADGGFHPGEMSIHVSRALGDHPEWRPLMRDLLEARGRNDVMRVFGL